VGRPRRAGGYRAVQAQERATALACRPSVSAKLVPHTPLWGHVVGLLRRRYSPEQIAGTLKRMHPDQPTLQVSHETIYTALYAMPRGALRTELIAVLRQGRKRRRSRAQGTDRRGILSNITSIHLRPPDVDERVIPGHWEGDMIVGQRNASAIGTLVERTTLFVTLARLEGLTADAVVDGFSSVLERIDLQRRLSMTYDQGKEMARHEQLTARTGVKVYFADPHSPWQRAINENTNGLLRQYFPKGTDLSDFGQQALDAVAWQLNTRPRKSLGWRCPAELFLNESFNFTDHYRQLVALQT